jgi:hypothetical protein
MDRLVLLKLTMAGADRDAFLGKSGLAQPQPDENPIQEGFGEELGWRLDDLKRFEGVDDDTGDPVRQVLIDTSAPATLTVYVAAFST